MNFGYGTLAENVPPASLWEQFEPSKSARSGSLSRVRLGSLDNFPTSLAQTHGGLAHYKCLQSKSAPYPFILFCYSKTISNLKHLILSTFILNAVDPCLHSWRHFWGKFAYLQEPLPTPLNALRSTIYSALMPMANAQNLSWRWMLILHQSGGQNMKKSSIIGCDDDVSFFWIRAICEVKNFEKKKWKMPFHAFSSTTRVKSL